MEQVINTEIKLKKIANLAPKVMGVLCVLYFFNSMLSGFFDVYSDRVELSNYLNFLVKVFQNTVFGFLLINILLQFKWSYLAYVLPFAHLEQAKNIFANKLHPLLLEYKFYNLFSENPLLISPEYPRVFVLFAILLASFVLLFTKRKTFQRLFLCLGAGAIFFTAVLFHTVILYEVNAFKKNDATTMESILNFSKEITDIEKMCAANQYVCYIYPSVSELDLFSDKKIPDAIQRELPYLKPYFFEESYFFWYGISHDSHAMNRLLGQTPFSIGRNKDFAVIMKNDGSYKEFFVVNQYVFAWLSLASHTVWFFGTLFLIYFHRKRIIIKKTEHFKELE